MLHQSSIFMDAPTQSPATTSDLDTILASRRSPGIVILNGLGEIVHVNDTAWQTLSVLRQHVPVSENGLVPRSLIDLCHELDTKMSGGGPVPSHARLEATHILSTVDGAVLLRALSLEGAKDLSGQEKRFLIMLEHVAEREPLNAAVQERYGLTAREWQVSQSLTQGFTNKEIGNALGITEPTVKAHIKHIMEKMKCTTRTAIVSRLAGSLVCASV